jgi:hypothetical protein
VKGYFKTFLSCVSKSASSNLDFKVVVVFKETLESLGGGNTLRMTLNLKI